MVLIGLFINGQGQERITIQDPEIVFSMDVPEGWKTRNDDYYFFVLNPKAKGSQLTITYYNENTPRDLVEIVDTRIKFSYPDIEGFKHIDSVPTTLSGEDALMVKYHSKKGKKKLYNEEYIFIKAGQIFYLLVTIPEEDKNNQLRSYQDVVLSFKGDYR